MLSYFKWTKKTIFCVILVILLVAIVNFVVDPYQYYRASKLYTFKVQDQRYLNAGLIKNYPYDTIVLGTSMVENFLANDVTKNLHTTKTLKAPFMGGHIIEISAALNLALKQHKAKTILIGIDIFSLAKKQDKPKFSTFFPFYMYESNHFQDYKYLLNKAVFEKSIKSLKYPYNQQKVENQLNSIYSWQDKFQNKFTLSNVLQDYHNHINKPTEYNKANFNYKFYKKNFDTYLLPQLQQAQDTHIILFYPPYSILTFKFLQTIGTLRDYIEFKQYLFKRLQKYKNIEIYDFQVAFEITNTLYYYKDMEHYDASINHQILQYISQKKYFVTKNNLNKYSKELLNNTNSFILPSSEIQTHQNSPVK